MDLPLQARVKKSMEWKHTVYPIKKKFRVLQPVKKVMLTVFLDMTGTFILISWEKVQL